MIPPVAAYLRECYLLALALAWLLGLSAAVWHWRRGIAIIVDRPGDTAKAPGALVLSEELRPAGCRSYIAVAVLIGFPLLWTLTFIFDWNPQNRDRDVIALFALLPPLAVFGLSRLPLILRLPMLAIFAVGLIYLYYVQESWGISY